MLGWTRNDIFFISALSLSIGLHMGLLWYKPSATKHTFEAPVGRSMTLTLGPPIPKETTTIKPVIDELITSAATDTQQKIIPEKPEVELEEIAKDISGELEELIVTREVKLKQKPISPIYPEKARRAKQEGLVLVRAQVDASGKTHAVKVSQSSGFPLLDKAAIQAVLQWSFLPAQENDQAITAWIEVPIDFKLR